MSESRNGIPTTCRQSETTNEHLSENGRQGLPIEGLPVYGSVGPSPQDPSVRSSSSTAEPRGGYRRVDEKATHGPLRQLNEARRGNPGGPAQARSGRETKGGAEASGRPTERETRRRPQRAGRLNRASSAAASLAGSRPNQGQTTTGTRSSGVQRGPRARGRRGPFRSKRVRPIDAANRLRERRRRPADRRLRPRRTGPREGDDAAEERAASSRDEGTIRPRRVAPGTTTRDVWLILPLL